jgi:hypothetical protein
MKAVPVPEEIASYTHDKSAEVKYRLPQVVLGVLSLSGLVGAFVFRRTEYGMLICGLLFVGALGLFGWLSSRKRNIACNHCSNPMEVFDVDWSAELFTQLGGRICGSFFTGADGRMYKQGRYRDQQNRSSNTIHVMKQRWYSCPSCQLCFLGEKLFPVTVFKASSGMKQAINNLKEDPNVGFEMEERHSGSD